MVSRIIGVIALITLSSSLMPAPVSAAQKAKPKLESSVSLRSYQFNHSFRTGSYQQAQNNALALHFKYGYARGLSAVATYYVAAPIHRQAANADASLPAGPIDSLGELYTQYATDGLVVRAGRQIVNTPWVNPADARLIPVSFLGVTANAKLGSRTTLYAARLGNWRNRTRSQFASDDLLTSKPTAGTVIGGLSYGYHGFSAALWQYQFLDVAHLSYAEAGQDFFARALTLHAKAQFAEEGDLGAHLAGRMQSHVAGAFLGATVGRVDIGAGVDHAPQVSGVFHNGGPASPYAYTSDPLYTTSMVTGLYNTGAGWSYKVAGNYTSLNKRLRGSLSRAMYFAGMPGAPADTTGETDLDISFALTKQLSVRNKTAFITSLKAPFQQTYNRVQFDYALWSAK